MTSCKPATASAPAVALRHLGTILRSFEPKHEHKKACVAYLMSLWFSDVNIPDEVTP